MSSEKVGKVGRAILGGKKTMFYPLFPPFGKQHPNKTFEARSERLPLRKKDSSVKQWVNWVIAMHVYNQ